MCTDAALTIDRHVVLIDDRTLQQAIGLNAGGKARDIAHVVPVTGEPNWCFLRRELPWFTDGVTLRRRNIPRLIQVKPNGLGRSRSLNPPYIIPGTRRAAPQR